MKKFVSIFLALAMILAMSATAFAAENTALTINNAEGRTFNGYKLLNLTTSLKCTDTTHTHDSDCYNYAYTVNETYETILQTQAGDVDILEYLQDQTNGTYGTLRTVAESIYREILKAHIDPDVSNLDGSDTIAQGYWLFADVTDLSEKEDKANSLVIIDTKGQDALTINPKVGLPTIEKKVQDTNDTTGVTSDWQDSADYDIGDPVPFQLTVTMPENLAYYETYAITIHDDLSEGLTLDEDSIVVKAGNTTVTGFTYAAGEDGKFTLTCNDVLKIEGITVTKDTVFVVTYNATLNDKAEIGAEGNTNEVYLQFSNNPYGDTTGKTKTDKVIVFTYKLVINKTDIDGNALKGAGFILYKKNAAGTYDQIGDELKGDNMTTFEWKGLDDGDYKLEEKTVPSGYNKMADIEFTITAEHSVEADDPALTSLTSTFGTVDGGVITESVVNRTGTILPETGAKGTMMLIACSSMFVMVAVVFMVTRKKMSIYED